MKNIAKLKITVIALIIGLGLVTLHSAFKTEKKTGYKYWRFDSNDPSNIRVANEYTLISNPQGPTCDNADEIPCVLKVDESIDTRMELGTYLQNTTLFPDDEDITSSAEYTKSAN
ncbi:hypothetical protein [Pedobacter sp.]|uniref:hypothetical protein n=1 Tax=Pedobacter sp. TaxID=1411316 RepID=UPI003BA8BC70